MTDLDEVRRRLVEMREEHRDLDEAIHAMTKESSFDQIQVQRLKKRKLALRDEIIHLESLLIPDIIA